MSELHQIADHEWARYPARDMTLAIANVLTLLRTFGGEFTFREISENTFHHPHTVARAIGVLRRTGKVVQWQRDVVRDGVVIGDETVMGYFASAKCGSCEAVHTGIPALEHRTVYCNKPDCLAALKASTYAAQYH